MQCFRNGLNFIGLLVSCVVYPLFAFKMWISAFIFLDLVAKEAKPSPLNTLLFILHSMVRANLKQKRLQKALRIDKKKVKYSAQ